MPNHNLKQRAVPDLHIFPASVLKALACVFMLIDHIGAKLFPQIIALRIIGRLAYPIFAFFIAEGCHYTRNKRKRLLLVFGLGVICELVFWDNGKGNILLTFSLSILLIYCLQGVKTQLRTGCKGRAIAALVGFAAAVLGIYALTDHVRVDYGFAGVITPVIVSAVSYKKEEAPAWVKRIDPLLLKPIALALGLLLIILQSGPGSPQFWCLLAVPLLMLYNGKPGKRKLKYGFYLFYPLHLALLELVSWWI